MFGRKGGDSTSNVEGAADRRRRGSVSSMTGDAAVAALLGTTGAILPSEDDEVRKLMAEAKFNEWVRWKDRFDRGLDLFKRLGEGRAENEDTWKEVAVALAAIDRSLDIDIEVALRSKKVGTVNADGSATTKARAGPQSMFDAFKKWSMDHHPFCDVVLTDAELASVSSGVKELMSRGPNDEWLLPSLKYSYPPPPPKRGLKVRPMTEDQKATNVIFMRRLKAAWLEANTTMRERVAQAVETSEIKYRTRTGLGMDTLEGGGMDLAAMETALKAQTSAEAMSKDTNAGSMEHKEGVNSTENESKYEAKVGEEKEGGENGRISEAKKTDLGANSVPTIPGVDSSGRRLSVMAQIAQLEGDEEFQRRKDRYIANALDGLGIRSLAAWLEADNDEIMERKQEALTEKRQEAKSNHKMWAAAKQKLLVKLPPEAEPQPGVAWKPPRFDFGGGRGLVRPNKEQFARTTVDLMKSSGAKYAYAMRVDDLEKCKQQVEEQLKREAEEREMRTGSEREKGRIEAFETWTQQKTLVDAAINALKYIDAPAPMPQAQNGNGSGWVGREDSGAAEARALWLEVGKALKAVDVRLLTQWRDWCKPCGRYSTSVCQAVWDVLPPMSCDTHSSGYSAIRETFMKLLRPGTDYRAAFMRVIQLRKARIDATRRRREDAEDAAMNGGGKRNAKVIELDEEDFDDDELSKRELKHLLSKELGIVLHDEEMRRLVDAFDTNQDQRVSWKEFESFTGGTRAATRGDAGKRLSQRCVWETTCPITGMPNAYVVSTIGKRSRNLATLSREDTNGAAQNANSTKEESKQNSIGNNSIVIELNNGEKRRKTELPERRKRLEILRRHGLLSSTNTAAGVAKYAEEGFESDGSGGGGAGYDDDFEQPNSRSPPRRASGTGGGDVNQSPGGSEGNNKKCAAVDFSAEKRQEALAVLKRLSRDNREAAELKKLLDEGTPPAPPKLWSAGLNHPDVGTDETALVYSLLLCWRAQPGSLVAFYSLEMSGAEGSKAFRQSEFKEICRDPQDADGDPNYQFWVNGLQPSTSYEFRIRGFNGFGGGGYTRLVVTTRPAAPPVPQVARAAPTEILLRWKFSSRYETKLKELRRVFEEADADNSGEVSRDELLSLLQSKHSGLMSFLKSCTPQGGAGSGLTVFDAIEANDDENISWDEFLRYFSNAGALDRRAGSSKSSHNSRPSSRGTQSDTSAPVNSSRYAVEQCEGEEGDMTRGEEKWKEVWKGTQGEALLKGLTPSTQHRFRVIAYNKDNVPGPPGQSVVASTLLETPAAPIVSSGGKGSALGPTFVMLRWETAVGKKGKTSKMLTEWAKATPDDPGVSAALAFAKYDQDDSGSIDAVELGALLEDLGVTPTEERLREAFERFDTDKNGLITFDEFEDWWHRDDITYVVKRDDGTCARDVELGMSMHESPPPLKVTSYRGKATECEIKGLAPNTLYRVRLRLTTARAQSALSSALEVMTTPRRPDAPVVVRTETHAIVLKWYPGSGSAHKYELQMCFVESLAAPGGTGSMGGTNDKQSSDEGWKTIYEGVDNSIRVTALTGSAVYRFRVCAINARGGASEWSRHAQAATDTSNPVWKSSSAASQFQVDCNGDIVVGDTIIFTERLYVDSSGQLMQGAGAASTINLTKSRPGEVTPRLSMSMASVNTEVGGEFIGERTVAAHVIKDSSLTMRKRAGAEGLQYNKASAAARVVRMEVLWTTVSRASADAFQLARGSVIERREKRLFQFEVFRALWVEDEHRKGVIEEWDLLGGL